MKTNHIALTLLASAALMLSACVNEKEIDHPSFEKNELAFRISTVQTRSDAVSKELGTYDLGTVNIDDGETIVLEESVESLDGGMATRGTPAFTENVVDLYGTFNAVAPNSNSTRTLPDASFAFDGETFWTHHYAGLGELWTEGAKYQFFMRMPGDIAENKYGLTSAPTYNTDGSIEFDYTSPEEATDQTDILFTSKTITKNEEEVYFYHVLTGVKFKNFFTNLENGETAIAKTTITEVKIDGLKNSGHCKVTPAGTSDYSSATVSVWSGQTGKAAFTQEYSGTTDYTLKEGETGENYGLDELLNKTAAERNLNNVDGSLTFWFVPQSFTAENNVTITVKFDVDIVKTDGTTKNSCKDEILTVVLGGREWKAGELHTFTLKPIHVGVELVDEMDEDKFVKSNVEVENKGNVWEYVRVNMIGNWVGKVQTAENVYDSEDVILMGFTSADEDDDTEVQFWNDKDGKTNYGTFVNLVQKSTSIPASTNEPYTINDWVRYDKYYYYTKPIGPDATISANLFDSYTVGPSPEFWIVDAWGTRRKAKDVHLVMDLMVQAIPAPVDKNGNVLDNDDNQGYIRAWVEALDKTDPDDLLDL